MKRPLIAILFVLATLPAEAQQFPTIPPSTVIGRLGNGVSGPSSAIPFSTFLPAIFGTQSANQVYAGPSSGTAAFPGFRALVGADLPFPGASSLGGVESLTCSSSNWFRTLSTGGALGCSQPQFSDIAGTIGATQLPNPGASSLGGVFSLAAVSHKYLTSITTGGQPVAAQPVCGDLSDATYCNSTVGQLAGIASATSANAGNIGQVFAQNILVGSAVSLTNNTAANIATISPTAGEWDISAQICFHGATTTVTSVLRGSISTTTGTENAVSPFFAAIPYPASSAVFSTSDACFAIAPTRISLGSTTQYWLVGFSNFATSTLAAYGQIRAVRTH